MAAAVADGLAPWAGGLQCRFVSSGPVGSWRHQSLPRRPGSKTGIPCLPPGPARVPPMAAAPFARPRWLPCWSTRQPRPARAALRQALSPPASLGKPLRSGQNRIILASEPQKVNWPANRPEGVSRGSQARYGWPLAPQGTGRPYPNTPPTGIAQVDTRRTGGTCLSGPTAFFPKGNILTEWRGVLGRPAQRRSKAETSKPLDLTNRSLQRHLHSAKMLPQR